MSKTQWILLSLFGFLIFGGLTTNFGTTIPDSLLQKIANAIATAEGFFVAGSKPQRHNNPGDLLDSAGNNIVFASLDDGWAALKHQIRLMLTGQSRIYIPSMTIGDIGLLYTGNDHPDSWANAVAESLGVSTDTPFNQIT